MKILIVVLIVSLITLFNFCAPENERGTAGIKQQLQKDFDMLQQIAEHDLMKSVKTGSAGSLKAAFTKTRNAYKRTEWFIEYYAPQAARELNGAPLPEIEIEETKVFPPSGLQVIEDYLYSEPDISKRKDLEREVIAFLSTLSRARTILDGTEFTEAHIMDASKLQVFRIIAMGISGFDTPLSQSGVQEASVSLSAVKQTLSSIGRNSKLESLFENSISYVDMNSSFDDFDRSFFITRYANPITREIVRWQRELKIPFLKESLAVTSTATTLFDPQTINVNYFAGNPEAQVTPEKVSLGKELLSSPLISGTSRTCSSCHKPGMAFTDGIAKSEAIQKGKSVKRNAPTLLYAGLQNAQFYDMRSPTLENQAMDVIANKDEMHASVADAAERLNKLPAYVKRFKAAFPTMEDEIKERFVLTALASYIRTLAFFSSPFDKFMRGDYTRLNETEIQGFNLFMGKAKCGTCHFMPVFNGTAPPAFSNTEAEVLGILEDPKSKIPVIDTDEGRYAHNKLDELKFSFKTPTLRNISKTAPYMHNGAYETLEEVMDFYNKGGAVGLGLTLENQTLPPDPLNLSASEQKAIIAFLQTLRDEEV